MKHTSDDSVSPTFVPNPASLSDTLGIPPYRYRDLHDPERLNDLMRSFDTRVCEQDSELFGEFREYRACAGEGMAPERISELLVRMAPWVGDFLARLFDVVAIRERQIEAVRGEFDSVFVYRDHILGKLPVRFKSETPEQWDIGSVCRRFDTMLAAAGDAERLAKDAEGAVSELAARLWRLSQHYEAVAAGKAETCATADTGVAALREKLAASPRAASLLADVLGEASAGEFVGGLLEVVCRWSYAAARVPDLKPQVAGWVSFKTPAKTDFNHLVEHADRAESGYTVWTAPPGHHRRRDGFALTDPGFGRRRVLYEVDHCIHCHDRDADSCAKGMRNKKDGSYKTNPLGQDITGCPLEEKISEMQWLKRRGDNIAALALIVIDNPMCPGTGHRICNDCMKACIYQKTEPVDIPQVETSVLTDVLFMPWGFEIYSLLTRWNPLNVRRPCALPYNGKNVLVAGMGPAGYTLSHYLLNEGFGVVGIDGLKIEPLPRELTGDGQTPPRPIRDFRELYEDLDKRVMLGFGGVAEYGITVRWDKNFLKVIYLNLLRRKAFRCYGGVRFGGTLTVDDAWALGFDHIAIASGAGKPTVIDLKNNLARGIRKASDFLMALQLTGAAKASSLANLQVRLPAGVVGGGLTAIDTATELLAYYPVQVSKILHRYEKLASVYGEETVRARYDREELAILDEFLAHGRVIQQERERAASAGETPDFLPLLEQWGGVTLYYRKGIKDSPAYRQNHEEVAKALEEGIRLAEGMNPVEAVEDGYGHLAGVRFEKFEQQDGKWCKQAEIAVPLRSLFVAAGTSPNTIYESEHPDTFEMDGKFYQRFEPNWSPHPGPLEPSPQTRLPKGDGFNSSLLPLGEGVGMREGEGVPLLKPIDDTAIPKIGKPAPFTSYRRHGRFITFYGDNHPVYAGNVVRAMASAKDGYPYIVKLFENHLAALDPAAQGARDAALAAFQRNLDDALIGRIVGVGRLTPTIIEVVVRAPMAASQFAPGQFYRVQNFETLAPVAEGTVLASEGMALTGAWVDKSRGLISLIALEMGSSTRLCATWRPGDPIVVMGVTGAPTDIPSGRTVLLAGGGLGNAVLFSIGKALRAAGNRVIYFAGYRNREDLFKTEDIEAASDLTVWTVDKRPGNAPIPVTRPRDKSFVGNIVEAMLAYGRGELGETPIRLDQVEHMIVIGSDRMMAAVKEARHGVLEPYLKACRELVGSINSPMQCMMKGVCAQCLCKHVDPETGKACFVYTCNNQDQALDRVDFANLGARLRQNSVQEKLSALWLDHVLERQASAAGAKEERACAAGAAAGLEQ
ncbi:oxidoreductase FAD/NAD(P)-binding domain-containing protein [Methylocaldum marinum]|uniref:Oxidoreductase FAD/NAD(P)-binding domain-containing protein n=1 Tax=Methylocaldum marinum TaxID=1432792 RepID=A0A250KYH4_9GAMM|nr:FAD-dependent oxidoreductase [Methylocaldum marinum]BBA36041.1 oxidoreductase FAD/NAD(P)-binding domain-containing protein [Methylocaldum marinum]